MYQINPNFNPICSYAQALKAWKTGVIFLGDNSPLSPRGLVNNRKKHMTVERTEAEDIILRLYNHPVVTWHKDNSLTFNGYNTRSSTVFANRCTPTDMRVSLCGGCFAVTVYDRNIGRTYRVRDQITFRQRDGTWKADRITPWSVPRVDRERAALAFRETGYNEFRTWLTVYLQMTSPSYSRISHCPTDDEVVGMVRNRKWRELVTGWPNSSADRVLSNVRQAIYRKYDCIKSKSVPFLG